MQIRKDSILEDLQVPFSKFIMAVQLFLLEAPVNKAHKGLDLAYNTAYKIYSKIREAIYQFVKEDVCFQERLRWTRALLLMRGQGKEVEELRTRCQCLAHLRDRESESGDGEGCIGR